MDLNLTSKKEGNTLTVSLSGELNTQSAPSFKELLEEQLPGSTQLILDFAECDFVSSAGLRILLSTFKKLQSEQGQMKIINVGANLKEVFFITGLDVVFGLREEAPQ